ncbi:MAG TPA: histidine kinase, partial [Puia sp.]|nr:histidine kinase [Puia sp.]
TQLLNSAYLLFVTGSLKFFKDWFLQQQQLKEKERQQIALELKFLKAQVHPHFFFNTLNNLYSLTLRKSDLAPEVVLKLSSLMSYMLYESGVSMVPLGKEIAHLEDYIALERLRFGDRLALTFRKDDAPMHDAPMHDAPTDDAPTDDAPMDDAAMEAIRIPPLLLITFVENSFKHGIGQSIGDGSIDISLHREQHHLVFSISNSVGELVTQPLGDDVSQEVHPFSRTSPMANQPLHTPVANGLGLKNAIRRLDLLYGSRYRIDRNQSDGHYHVTLKIPLA